VASIRILIYKKISRKEKKEVIPGKKTKTETLFFKKLKKNWRF